MRDVDSPHVRELESSLFVSALVCQALTGRLDVFDRENAHLRVVAQNVSCPYGHRAQNGGCVLGYPGCACMDDLMAVLSFFPTEDNSREMRALNRMVAKNDVLEKRLMAAQRRLSEGVRQFRSMANGFRAAREPSKAAAIDGLADMMETPL